MSQRLPPEAFLEWQPQFELGVEEIDEQHRGLSEAINGLAHSILDDDATAAFEFMRRLLIESRAHFDFEEDLMRRRAYPAIEAHAEQHDELLASMGRLRDELASGKYAINRPRTLQFLRDWFAIHIVRTDGPLADFLRSNEIAGPA